MSADLPKLIFINFCPQSTCHAKLELKMFPSTCHQQSSLSDRNIVIPGDADFDLPLLKIHVNIIFKVLLLCYYFFFYISL